MNPTTPHTPLSESTIRRMVEFLILNSSFTSDLGLFHGKMGIVIFFAHYARWTRDSIYDDFAYELLAEIYEDIHADTPINLESGLCGIGWGIEYLVQNGFMEGNTDEILADIDRRIMERDPRRITDLSFRTGLGGILFYAIARLTASRERDSHPFDALYLNDLKEAAQQARFSEQDEIPSQLIETFLLALKGESILAPQLPQILFDNLPTDTENYQTYPLGLEKGIAGILISSGEVLLLKELSLNTIAQSDATDSQKSLYIINQESRAAMYGIGTYIRQLVEVMRNTEWKISVVYLNTNKYSELVIREDEYVRHIYVPIQRSKEGNSAHVMRRTYRNTFYLLRGYVKEMYPVFHFQYMKIADLIINFKRSFPNSKIILTVHYTDWSFLLLGDRKKLEKSLYNAETLQELGVKESIEEDKKTLNLCSEGIIAISQYSYDMLLHDYGISGNRLTLVRNGLVDKYVRLSMDQRTNRRKYWGIDSSEIVLLIAGRVDEMKGTSFLVQAYKELRIKYPHLRLIISGDGEYNSLMQEVTPFHTGVTFTGFLSQEQLYQLYSIADMGVLPSLHEEFGYVALEMMMMGLPLIVGQTTGLSELVLNHETGITIPVDHRERIADELIRAISLMIDDVALRKKYGENGRKRYLDHYGFELFSNKLKAFYSNLFN